MAKKFVSQFKRIFFLSAQNAQKHFFEIISEKFSLFFSGNSHELKKFAKAADRMPTSVRVFVILNAILF
jgi:hypothetical protein